MRYSYIIKLMNRKIILLLCFLPLSVFAQIGGESAFSFVDLDLSPRFESMGGGSIAIYDDDLSLAQTTPSLLSTGMHNSIVFNFCDYFSDIRNMGFSFARGLKEIGVFSIGIRAIDYGEFNKTDAVGNDLGIFNASDQVFTLGFGKRLNKYFTIGFNLNFLNSRYENYYSTALSSNLSATYFNSENDFTATFLIKNMGKQLNAYDEAKESLPLDLQFGLSKELKHLPFRYSLTLHHLNQFDIASPYKLISQTNSETGELEIKQESKAKTALRHLIIGAELNPFRKSFFLRGGFNFQRRFDLSLATYPGFVGFSWGLGFKISKFRLDFSRASYHLSGTPNSFSISTNFSTFKI